MKRIYKIALFTGILITFVCISVSAATITSLNEYLQRQEFYEQNGNQAAPTSASDAGTEIFSSSDGNLIYKSIDVVLPQVGGFELPITRKLNKNTTGGANGQRMQMSIAGGRSTVYGEKVLAEYSYRPNGSGSTWAQSYKIAYNSEEDLFAAENTDGEITGVTHLNNPPPSYYDSATYMTYFDYPDITYNAVGVFSRKPSIAPYYLSMQSTNTYTFTKKLKNSDTPINSGWEYDLPRVEYDKVLKSTLGQNKTYEYGGTFYDAFAEKALSISFTSIENTATGQGSITDAKIYNYDNSTLVLSGMYNIGVVYTSGEPVMSITRYDGIVFKFEQGFHKITITDKHENQILAGSYGNYQDSYGRNIVINAAGITINGTKIVGYSQTMENDKKRDPTKHYVADNTYFFHVNKAGKITTYEISQIDVRTVLKAKTTAKPEVTVGVPGCIIKKVTLASGGGDYIHLG